jgi:hypothetical protein
VARFEAERQALAMMDHPNIAKVLDAGCTDNGRPYFVMELVKGVPINEFCDDNRLTTRERLELFTQVCQAVHHAHQKGIIHRDLKPSNVLVALYDDKPVPKVIDFGVAKATNQQLTEKTLFTEIGSILGTLEYMSPEQAVLNQLDVDTRSDVYSLGVLLYELLTGETPLDRQRLREAQIMETLRMIREDEPLKPSTRVSSLGEKASTMAAYRRVKPESLVSEIRGDLDWIVIKSLAKERSRRYDSANRFAEDIQRHLDNDIVEARPPSTWYRLRKTWSRNRAFFTTASVVVVAMLILISVTSVALVAQRFQTQRFRKVLAQLHTARAASVAEHVFSGDIHEARAELKETENISNLLGWTDESRGWHFFNQAHIAVQEGKYEYAGELLQKAQSYLPSSTPCAALIVANQRLAGNEWNYWLGFPGLDACEPTTFDDYLFRGFAYSWGNPLRGVADLEVAKKKAPSSAVARLLLAQALYAKSQHSLDADEALKFAEQAVGESAVGSELLARDNSFAATTRILAATKHYQLLEKRNGLHSDEVKLAREELLHLIRTGEQLDYSPQLHYSLVMADRVLHPQQLASGPATFQVHELATVKETQEVRYAELIYHYANRDYESCRALLDEIGTEVIEHISYVMLIKAEIDFQQHEDEDRLVADYVELLRGERSPQRDLRANSDWVLLSLIGADEEARRRAGDFLRHCKKHLDTADGITRRILPTVRVMQQGDWSGTFEEHVKIAKTTRERTFIAFKLGVLRLAQGKRAEAKACFEDVVSAGFYEMADDNMSRVFLMRINDDDWLPWLPNDGSLRGTKDSDE